MVKLMQPVYFATRDADPYAIADPKYASRTLDGKIELLPSSILRLLRIWVVWTLHVHIIGIEFLGTAADVLVHDALPA